MDKEIARTILVPFCTIAIFLIARIVFLELKQWQKRRMMERGITNLANRIRGAGKSEED